MERARKATIDFAAMMEPVARHFWGEPNAARSNHEELRWGNHGARSVDLGRGTWFDHEDNVGGGALDLIERETRCDRAGAMRWLSDNDFITNSRSGSATSREEAPRARIVAQYKYRAEDGELLYEVVRFDPKDFRQRRPDGKWGIKGIRRVLFRLPELIAAVEHCERIYVPEGERDVLALSAEGLAATTNPMGANKWADEYNEFLRGADIVLLPDNDRPGRDHVADVANRLNGIARSVRILDLAKHWPEGEAPEKGDVRAWLGAGGTKERLDELAAAAPEWQAPPVDEVPDDDGAKDGGGVKAAKGAKSQKQADVLIAIAAREATLFHTAESLSYADFEINGHRETWPARSTGFRRWLMRRYYEETDSAPNSEAISTALNVIEAKAVYDGSVREVHMRIAAVGEDTDLKVYLDLADADWRVIEIDSNGWRILDSGDVPVRFCRRPGSLALPLPELNGSIDELRRFVNVSKFDFPLLVAYLVAALRGRGPFPVLVPLGEAGAAKSTLTRVIKSLIDPTKAPLRTPPRENRDIFIAANNSYVIALDNLSALPGWLSDTLCRLSTGGGFATRELYSDEGEKVFDAMRPLILNAIENVVVRHDLADRSIFMPLGVISDARRCPEDEFWNQFEHHRAGILGALLDAVAHGLRTLPEIDLGEYPRMADFVKWATACESALWPAGTFAKTYEANRTKSTADVIEADMIATALTAFMEDLFETEEKWEWKGETGPLLKLLSNKVDEDVRRDKHWPKHLNVLAGKLKRAAPALRRAGFGVRSGYNAKSRRVWTITNLAKVPEGA